LLQALSPECTEFNDAKPGHFWHTISEETLGRSIKIVPVYTDISYILWRPRHMGSTGAPPTRTLPCSWSRMARK
jgi:hypothetical protein